MRQLIYYVNTNQDFNMNVYIYNAHKKKKFKENSKEKIKEI